MVVVGSSEGQLGTQADIHTDERMDRQLDRWTNRLTDRNRVCLALSQFNNLMCLDQFIMDMDQIVKNMSHNPHISVANLNRPRIANLHPNLGKDICRSG